MSVTRSCDAIVIGGDSNGFIAAAYLARSGRNVMLFDAGDTANKNSAHTLVALDAQVAKDLKLAKLGLRLAARDLALVNLRNDGRPLVIRRDIHATVAELAVQSQHDAQNWPRFRRELFDLGRAMRPFWLDGKTLPGAPWSNKLDYMARTSAAAWLDSWFESDALKAALCFDAAAGGISVIESGSALSLVWRAAQEISGLQAAVAFPNGGLDGLAQSLVRAAETSGCELHPHVAVSELLLDGDRVTGARLASGETVFAPVVFSSLSRPATFAMLPQSVGGIAQTAKSQRAKAPLSAALVTLALKEPVESPNAPRESRFVIADRVDTYISAELAARKGELAVELPMEVMMPSLLDPSLVSNGPHLLSVLVRPTPLATGDEAFHQALVMRVIGTLENVVPGFANKVSGFDISRVASSTSVEHMLTPTAERVASPLSELFFCGADAEPVPAISGNAARIASELLEARPR